MITIAVRPRIHIFLQPEALMQAAEYELSRTLSCTGFGAFNGVLKVS